MTGHVPSHGKAAGERRLPPVRAVTLGLPDPHPLSSAVLEEGARVLARCRAMLSGAGYEVQTVRLSTRPLLGDMGAAPDGELDGYLGWLQAELDRLGLAFLSLGPVMPEPGQLARTRALAAMLASRGALNWSISVAGAGTGLSVAAAEAAGQAMSLLGQAGGEGLGNFNFAATACVRPGAPFFPAAYHRGPASFSMAFQGAGTVGGALAGGAGLDQVAARVARAMEATVRRAVEVGYGLGQELGATFGGVDLSPAPDGDDSIVAAMEMAGHGLFGGPGTLALCAAVTAGLQSTSLPTCGYCGLMLPVMEDSVLARRWEEELVGLDQLLAFSAVCGTGLDTVPVPGDASPAELSRVVADMASLALRYDKPLSARLMPVPGALAGDRSRFSSPYLVNTVVKGLVRPA